MEKIASIFILYNPLQTVESNIASIQPFIAKVYLADNSEHVWPHCEKLQCNFPEMEYLHDGENKGIAARLNQICELAIQEGYNWLLTMDQDSYFSENEIKKYFSAVFNYSGKAQVAMFGVKHGDKAVNKKETEKVEELITSGSLINLRAYKEVGKFDEDYFIDQVDTEYCLRSISKGFDIVVCNNVFMEHNLGEISAHRSLKTGKITQRSLHSPVRLYYMTRNFLFLRKQYKSQFPHIIQKHLLGLLNEYKNNLLYNKKRFTVLKFIFAGFFAYLRGQKGKL